MSREWQIGDIVEKRFEDDQGEKFTSHKTAVITAINVTSSIHFGTLRWVHIGQWSDNKTQAQLEESGWRLVDASPLIPPGTQTHQFTDIPDDDLLTPREGHPYT